jgi:hypothetical protein
MRREILLHIGLSKTGTSSIQAALDTLREALAARGTCVPLSPGKVNHGLLAMAFAGPSVWRTAHSGLWGGLDPERRLAQFREEFLAEMAALPETVQRIVLSAEQLSHAVRGPARITELRRFLEPFASRFRIIVYLRRQDSHFASAQVQMLRSATIVPLRLPASRAELAPLHLDHVYDGAALLEAWGGVFGEDALEPRLFERESLIGGDAVEDFLSLIGAAGMLPPDAPERQRNLSVSPQGIALMLAAARMLQAEDPATLSPASTIWTRFVTRVGEAMPGRGWRPPAAEARRFLGLYAEANEAVRRRWFPGRAALFRPVEETEGDPEPPEPPPLLRDACRLLFRELAETSRIEARAARSMGAAEERLKNPARALARYRHSLRFEPEDAGAHAALCRLLAAEGEPARARLHLETLRRVAPDHPRLGNLERVVARAARARRAATPAAAG